MEIKRKLFVFSFLLVVLLPLILHITIKNNFSCLYYLCSRSKWFQIQYEYELYFRAVPEHTEAVLHIMKDSEAFRDVLRNTGIVLRRRDSELYPYLYHVLTNPDRYSDSSRRHVLSIIRAKRIESAIPAILWVMERPSDRLSGEAILVLEELDED